MKLRIALILLIFTLTTSISSASKLPDDLWAYIKGQIPSASQRFDSVVVVSKDTMYVPLYPAQEEDVEQIKVEYTYPKDKSLKTLPEVVIFNDNFVLLKLFKDKDGAYKVTQNEDLPLKVRLGVMPQDMLVPPGLKIPDSLSLILGDLVIPSISDSTMIVSKDGQETKITPLAGQVLANELFDKGNFKALDELKNKKIYVSSNGSKFINVYDENSANPLYELKLNALPLKIIASNISKMGVTIYFNNKNAEIMDLQNERIIAQEPLEGTPRDVIIDDGKNIAYISTPDTNTIYIMEIPSGRLSKAIKVVEQPSKMALSRDKKSIAYIDRNTQKLYVLELEDKYSTRLIGQTKNASGLIYEKDFIYALSRTQNELIVFNAIKGTIEHEIATDKKPTDMLMVDGKIYILCAQDGLIDVFNTKTNKIIDKISLDKTGFYANITKFPDQNSLIITGYNTKKFEILDCSKDKITKKGDLDVQVSNILIIDK